jgi:hypothetical protein
LAWVLRKALCWRTLKTRTHKGSNSGLSVWGD